MRDINEITGEIVDAAYQLHTRLGPGLLESVYEAILANMLNARGLRVERQKPVPLDYEGLHFEEAYRADLIVEGRVLVEIKSVERMSPVFNKQVLTYLRLLQFPVGLLINFGADSLNEGLRRIVNQRVDSLASADLRRAEKH
ncbi:MAG TPA: GxxExxY protein [Longimicrobium sp.]|jgi:iron complex transport system substrate-binding protein